MLRYEGHPLDLTCPGCQGRGTAWFSPDEGSHLRVDEIPPGFILVNQPLDVIGPRFSCVTCEVDAQHL